MSDEFRITLDPAPRVLIENARDEGYKVGHRMAWQQLLQTAICELRGDGISLDEPAMALAVATLQLERCRAALRQVCRIYGDNDWSDDLDLGDVVEKHLHRYLDEAQGG